MPTGEGSEPGVADNRTLYDMLAVSPDADSEALRRAFRRRSKALHPDTTALPQELAAREFQRLCEAYAQLADPVRRRRYDAGLQATVGIAPVSPPDAPSMNSGWGSVGVRRPLSGGEWLSIVMLVAALLLCLLLGVGGAWLRGLELQVAPSWLQQEQTWDQSAPLSRRDDRPAAGPDASESAFPALSGALVEEPGGQPQR
jgi:curved DNA-binding protein CbpA